MSRTIRKQLFQALITLRKANGYIERLIVSKREKELSDLLLDCQDCAIAIGNKIEKIYKENTEAVHSLEEYCETIYLISQNEVESVENEQLIAQTRIQLLETQAYMEQEIPDRIEAVFLPYKAAMWDSLESVWLAARDDVECDAYVIPIPYYDRNQDGSFGEMHYEGDEYPDYVPITSWEKYDLEERRPDIVYIHNPYDDMNIVTSVHPNYYSKVLKTYTGKLIYIPYFVLGQKNYDEFWKNPAIYNADTVIVANMAAKRACERSMLQDLTNTVLDDKILPLGSPKIDKAIVCMEKKQLLSDEWRKCIQKRMVVFYNTGISGLLSGNEQELIKIENTLHYFQKNKNFVLWWRPHPLGEATILSMRPNLYKKYIAIIQKYKKDGYGIYDDNPDLYLALAHADIYYGDDSSVTYLFGVLGKPIMIQNVFVDIGGKNKSIELLDGIITDNLLFFCANNHNSLYELSLDSGKVECLGKTKHELDFDNNLYCKLFKQNNEIWLIPNRAHHVSCYNLTDKSFTTVDFMDEKQNVRFIKYATIYNDKIYMIKSDYSALYILDTNLRSIQKKDICIDFGSLLLENPICRNSATADLIFQGQNIFFLIMDTNILVKYGYIEETIQIIKVGDEIDKFGKIVYQNNGIWCIPSLGGRLIYWKKDKCHVFDKSILGNCTRFVDAKKRGENLILIPDYGKSILEFNTSTLCMKEIKISDYMQNFGFVKVLSNKNIVLITKQSVVENKVYLINEKNEISKQIIVQMSHNKLVDDKSCINRIYQEDYPLLTDYRFEETEECNIDTICNSYELQQCISNKQKEHYRNTYANSAGNSGLHIWENTSDKQNIYRDCKTWKTS